jgi:hypothetical protein
MLQTKFSRRNAADESFPSARGASKSSTNDLGKGNRAFAHTPSRNASSWASQRSRPWLATTIVSGVIGDESGRRTTSASASASFSVRLLRWTNNGEDRYVAPAPRSRDG